MEHNRVIRWPISITAANNSLRFYNGSATSDQQITPGEYFVEGDGSADCLLEALRAAFETAYDDVYGSGGSSIEASLSTKGNCTLHGAANYIAVQETGTTFDPQVLGFRALSYQFLELDLGEVVTGYRQHQNGWYPYTDHVVDTGEAEKIPFSGTVDIRGLPTYVRHASLLDASYSRRVFWDNVLAARVRDSLAALSDYASVAEVAQSDPSVTIARLLEHVIDNGQVYLYDGDNPDGGYTITRSGPYYVRLPEQFIEFGTVDHESEREDLLRRSFQIALEFCR